jgi:hypothetical protein
MATTPKGPLDVKSLEEYRAAHPFNPSTYSPQVQATFKTQLDPAVEANFQTQAQNAHNAMLAANNPTDYAKAADAYNTILSQETTARQAALTEGNKNLLAKQGEWDAGVTSSYNKAQEIQQQSAADIAKTKANAQIASQTKVLDGLDTTAQQAHDTATQLDEFRTLSQAAGNPTLVQAASPELRNWLINSHILSPAEAQSASTGAALDAANAKLTLNLKNGSGIQRLTNMDLGFLERQTPGGAFTPQQVRNATLGFHIAAAQHQQQYVAAVHNYVASGMNVAQAQQQADKDVGPVIQQIPQAANGVPLNTPQARNQWAQENLAHGSYFKDQSGRLGIAP